MVQQVSHTYLLLFLSISIWSTKKVINPSLLFDLLPWYFPSSFNNVRNTAMEYLETSSWNLECRSSSSSVSLKRLHRSRSASRSFILITGLRFFLPSSASDLIVVFGDPSLAKGGEFSLFRIVQIFWLFDNFEFLFSIHPGRTRFLFGGDVGEEESLDGGEAEGLFIIEWVYAGQGNKWSGQCLISFTRTTRQRKVTVVVPLIILKNIVIVRIVLTVIVIVILEQKRERRSNEGSIERIEIVILS